MKKEKTSSTEEGTVLGRLRRLIGTEESAGDRAEERSTDEEADRSEEADSEADRSAHSTAITDERTDEETTDESSEDSKSSQEAGEIDRLRKELLEARAEAEEARKELEETKAKIAEARREGEIAGRNARIEEFLETPAGDGLPAMGPSATPANRADSIFSLAAGAR